MKNLINYYAACYIPLLAIFLLSKNGMPASIFAIALLFHCTISIPYLSGLRLYELGAIQKREIWKMWLPFFQFKFFTLLHFNKK